MIQDMTLFTFFLNERRYALPLSCVDRVIASVEITPLPGAPDSVPGAINIQGRIIPALNLRKRLGLPEKALDLGDHFIIATAAGGSAALVADAVEGVVEIAGRDVTTADRVFAETGDVRGVARLKEGMIILLDADRIIPRGPAGEARVKEESHV